MPWKIGEVAKERKNERARPKKNDLITLTIYAWGSKTSEH
jgi:hypothetical protein